MQHCTELPSAHVERDSAEWSSMWAEIVRQHGSADCLDETTGETWQYMGTVHGSMYALPPRWWHQFRHCCLPETGARTYVNVGATRGWSPDHDRQHKSCGTCQVASIANETECPDCGLCLKGGE